MDKLIFPINAIDYMINVKKGILAGLTLNTKEIEETRKHLQNELMLYRRLKNYLNKNALLLNDSKYKQILNENQYKLLRQSLLYYKSKLNEIEIY